MPQVRIPSAYTNQFKLNTVNDFLQHKARGVPLRAYYREIGVNPATITATRPIEDALQLYVKDTRRNGLTVSRLAIVAEAKRLLPEALEGHSFEACLAWCSRMLKRCGFTIRRVTHSGRNAKENLDARRLAFADKVVRVIAENLVDPHLGLCPRWSVDNMDQTAMFASAGVLTTVDVRGAKTVSVNSGGEEMYRCTMAVTACADGRVLPPHFVCRGKRGGDVEREVSTFADSAVATFSAQSKAWFDERVMLEWIDKCSTFVVTGPCILILDSSTVHKCAAVASRLAEMGTMVLYVPRGATSVAQPLDVGVVSPQNPHYRRTYAERHLYEPFAADTSARRREMFELAMGCPGLHHCPDGDQRVRKGGVIFPDRTTQ